MPHASDQAQVGQAWRQLQAAYKRLEEMYKFVINGYSGPKPAKTVTVNPKCVSTVYEKDWEKIIKEQDKLIDNMRSQNVQGCKAAANGYVDGTYASVNAPSLVNSNKAKSSTSITCKGLEKKHGVDRKKIFQPPPMPMPMQVPMPAPMVHAPLVPTVQAEPDTNGGSEDEASNSNTVKIKNEPADDHGEEGGMSKDPAPPVEKRNVKGKNEENVMSKAASAEQDVPSNMTATSQAEESRRSIPNKQAVSKAATSYENVTSNITTSPQVEASGQSTSEKQAESKAPTSYENVTSNMMTFPQVEESKRSTSDKGATSNNAASRRSGTSNMMTVPQVEESEHGTSDKSAVSNTVTSQESVTSNNTDSRTGTMSNAVAFEQDEMSNMAVSAQQDVPGPGEGIQLTALKETVEDSVKSKADKEKQTSVSNGKHDSPIVASKSDAAHHALKSKDEVTDEPAMSNLKTNTKVLESNMQADDEAAKSNFALAETFALAKARFEENAAKSKVELPDMSAASELDCQQQTSGSIECTSRKRAMSNEGDDVDGLASKKQQLGIDSGSSGDAEAAVSGSKAHGGDEDKMDSLGS